jgi:DNA-binding CsgD family transcriptional regulator
MTRLGAAELVATVLGGLADPALCSAIWTATGGERTAVVDLARAARVAGRLERGVEAWTQVAPLPVQGLRAFVGEARLHLGTESRDAYELLGLAGPVKMRVAAALVRPVVVRELERRGLVALRADGRLAPTDPHCAEVVRAALPPERRRVLLERLAAVHELIADEGLDDDQELLRLAGWRLEVGGWSRARFERAAAGAFVAGRPVLANALAGRAVARGPGSVASWVLALTRAVMGPASLDTAPQAPALDRTEQGDPTAAAVLAATVAALTGGAWSEATTRLELAYDRSGNDPRRQELALHAALYHALGGRPLEARRWLAGPAASDGVASTSGVPLAGAGNRSLAGAGHRSVAGAVAAVVAYDRDEPLEPADAALLAPTSVPVGGHAPPFVDPTRSVLAHHLVPFVVAVARGLAVLGDDSSRPPGTRERARRELEVSLAEPGPAAAWWSLVEARVLLREGDAERAVARLRGADLCLEEVDPLRLRPGVRAELALAAVTAGAAAEAERWLIRVGHDRETNPGVAARCDLAGSLLLAIDRGERAGARAALRAGDRAAAGGRRRDAVAAWHLAVRLGGTDGPLQRLATVAVRTRDTAIARDHAEALASGEPRRLERVARDAAAAGRYLAAAEAAAQAVGRGGGARTRALATALAAACHSARTPALDGVARATLSPRRREAAALVLRGHRGPEIAARMGVSVRTVDNHLAAVYRQVGVRDRRELTSIFEADRPPFTSGSG